MPKLSPPPEYCEPHYSTKLFRVNYQYIARFYDKDLFVSVCKELGMPLDYVLDDDNWVSNKFLRDFMARLKDVTGDSNLAENMGRAAIFPEAFNPIEYAINRALVGPFLFYIGMAHQYGRYNAINEMKLRTWRIGHYEYVVRPKGPITADEDVCKNTVGILSATEQVFALDSISVSHPSCIHHGFAECIFIVDVKATTFWKRRLATLFNLVVLGGIGLLGLTLLKPHVNPKFFAKYFFISTYLFGTLAFYFTKRYLAILKYIQQYNEQSRTKAGELYESFRKLDQRYQESNLLRTLSMNLSESLNPREVIASCLEELKNRFGYPRTLIMLLSAQSDALSTVEARGFGPELGQIYRLSVGYPTDRENPQLFANILEKGKTVAISRIEDYKQALKPENRALLEMLEVNSIIVAPIQDKENKYGLLIVGSVGSEQKLTSDDESMIDNVARLLSISFQRASNFEREKAMRTLFQKYVPAMVLEGISTLSPAQGKMAPKITIVTSMFVDLRDFTSRCETLHPDKLVEMVNLYTEFVTARIAAAGGIIDKLSGDGINAFFPADNERRTQHARAALLSAVYILSDIDWLENQFLLRGFGPAALGIGLHTGSVTVGNMGCDRKLDYTAVGRAVNIAARLQNMSKEYRAKTPSGTRGILLVSEGCYRRAACPLPLQKIGSVSIRGSAKKETVYFMDVESAQSATESLGKDYAQLGKIINRISKEHQIAVESKASPMERRKSDRNKKAA